MKRRKFICSTAIGLTGIGITSSCNIVDNKPASKKATNQSLKEVPEYRKHIKSSFAPGNSKGANDKVIVGIIGLGSWGTNLIIEATKADENIFVKYACDVDDTKGGRAVSELEKIQNFKPIRVRDMRRIFDDKEVDAVFIETPEHWHALATIWACQAGKDVYVEKCVSHNIFEGQQMIQAAMKYERIIQCGTQNRSADYAYTARDYIKSGELGEIVAVHVRGLFPGPLNFSEKDNTEAPDTIDWDMWLGPAPKVPYNITRNKDWLSFWEYGGGNAMANECTHELDLARLVLDNPGFPKSVYCTGSNYFNPSREIPDYQLATFDYGNFILTLETGECMPYMQKSNAIVRFSDAFPEWMQNATRIQILGSKKMMYVGRMGGGWQVYDKEGELVAQEPGYYPLLPHIKNYFDSVRTRNQPNSNIIEGHKSAIMIHLANLSYRADNAKLLFSPETESISNDDKAFLLSQPSYRNGFEITKNI